MKTVKTFKEIVGEAIGEASMCWSEIPKGIFDSNRASQLVDKILEARNDRKTQLETQIMGHYEAMRPLLDEWYELEKSSDPQARREDGK